MRLLDRYLKKELKTYQDFDVRFQAVGDIKNLPKHLQNCIQKVEEATKNNKSLIQVLALNYGGRAEITSTINKLIAEGQKEITEEDISNNLQTPYSDIDLLVRTSGEERISNFLLWQLSYSEFYFSSTLWPDFTDKELDKITQNYENRTRRFGGIK